MDANLLKSQISLWRKRNILGDAVGGESLSLQVDGKSADAAAGPTIKKAAAVLYSTALYGHHHGCISHQRNEAISSHWVSLAAPEAPARC